MAFGASAQTELVMPLMPDVFQSSWTNPAVWPEHTVRVGLPGISSVYGQGASTGFLLKDVMEFRNDTAYLMPEKLVSGLKPKNMVYAGTSVDLLHVRVKFKNGFYWVAARTRAEVNTSYPKELISLLVEGNAPWVGRTLDLGNLSAGATVYNEYSAGASQRFGDLVVGVWISFLTGIAQAGFEPRHLKIGIDSTMYAYAFDADARLRTAGLPGNAGGSPDFSLLSDPAYAMRYFSRFKNPGFSFSAGATWQMNDRIGFSVSVSDLGFISWKDSVTQYTMSGQSSFEGLDLLRSYLSHTPVNADSVFDAMADDFERDTLHTRYTTRLHPQFRAGARLSLLPRTQVDLVVTALYNRRLYPAVTLGISQGFGRYFNMLLSASYNRTIHNLGLGLMFKPGPVQFYLVADNLYPLISPMYVTNLNVRAGVNLVFGRVKKEQGLPYR